MAKLQPQAVKLITEIVERFKDEPTPTMMILEEIQREYGYVPLEVQELVSQLTGIPVSEIYGVVTFYSFFSMVPKGKYVVGVCLGTACYVKGSQLRAINSVKFLVLNQVKQLLMVYSPLITYVALALVPSLQPFLLTVKYIHKLKWTT